MAHNIIAILQICTQEFTLPAGTNGELSLDLGGVQWVVLCDQEGLKGGSIHKQRHGGELHIQHIVMPLFVTHLQKKQQSKRKAKTGIVTTFIFG